jgi:hypothetical protein
MADEGGFLKADSNGSLELWAAARLVRAKSAAEAVARAKLVRIFFLVFFVFIVPSTSGTGPYVVGQGGDFEFIQ